MEDKTELDKLKEVADAYEVDYHPSIGLTKLQAKVNEAMGIVSDPAEEKTTAPVETKGQKNKRLKNEANALQRVIVTCMNPHFKEYQGNFFSTGNRVVGTIRKYVAFGVEYHVPNMLLDMIETKEFTAFTNGKDSKGRPAKLTSKQKAYAIQRLAPLTADELKDLAQRQAMANGTAAAK